MMSRFVSGTQETPRKFDLSWSLEEQEVRGQAIAAMLESPAWEFLIDALGQYAQREHKLLIQSSPGEKSEADFERHIGLMEGLRRVDSIARGVVETGRTAASKMRAA